MVMETEKPHKPHLQAEGPRTASEQLPAESGT